MMRGVARPVMTVSDYVNLCAWSSNRQKLNCTSLVAVKNRGLFSLARDYPTVIISSMTRGKN